MYETDTGIGGGVFLNETTFTIPASSALAVPYGTFVFIPQTGLLIQVNTALQGATAVWVSVPLNPVKSDGAAVKMWNSTTTAITTTLIEVNLNA